MRIEIIGGMGVGKTTLCRALENQGLKCIYESLEKNPYLDLCYKDPQAYGFYSQISFILGNFYTAVQASKMPGINFLDYSTVTDKAYASLFLNGKARTIALDMIEYMEEKEGLADLYLYLTCAPETQLKRIKGRNRDHEKGVNIDFVRNLDAYTTRFVHEAEQNGARIITLDTEEIDLNDNMDAVTALTMKIRQMMQTSYTWSPKDRVLQPFTRKNASFAQPVEMAEAV